MQEDRKHKQYLETAHKSGRGENLQEHEKDESVGLDYKGS